MRSRGKATCSMLMQSRAIVTPQAPPEGGGAAGAAQETIPDAAELRLVKSHASIVPGARRRLAEPPPPTPRLSACRRKRTRSALVFPPTRVRTFLKGKKLLLKSDLLADSALETGRSHDWFAVRKEEFDRALGHGVRRLTPRKWPIRLRPPPSHEPASALVWGPGLRDHVMEHFYPRWLVS